MQTRAAALLRPASREEPADYEVIDVELDPPQAGEVLVKLVAAGLCHSDDHPAKGDSQYQTYPMIGGHEGAGVVVDAGAGTDQFAVGDHVVFSCIPACGRCRWCSAGMQNLCRLGRNAAYGSRPDDNTSYRVHLDDGRDVGQVCSIGAFAEYTTVAVESLVKVPMDLSLDKLCLLGCAVGTGWGSAVNSAHLRPGNVVIIAGIGGVGANAVQGAVHQAAAHILAVDPVPFKREAALRLGATQVFEDLATAADVARSYTDGQGADAVILTIGVLRGQHVADAFAAIRKGGTVVVTGVAPQDEIGIPISIAELTLYQKRIQGALFGKPAPCGTSSTKPRCTALGF